MEGRMTGKQRLDRLSRYCQQAEQCFGECRSCLEENRQEILGKIKEELVDSMEALLAQFEELREAGEAGELRYGFLSFLRTGIRGLGSWFRLDLYDDRERISETECGKELELSAALDPWRQGIGSVWKELGRQSQVRDYELEPLVFQLAEGYQKQVQGLLGEAMLSLLEESGEKWFGEGPAEIWQGEFMDQAAFLCGWEQGGLVTEEEKDGREKERLAERD